MAYREGVFTPEGQECGKDYPHYQDIFDDDAAYDDTASYPAGLEKIGWTVNETFLKLSYQFPNAYRALSATNRSMISGTIMHSPIPILMPAAFPLSTIF